MKNIQTSFVLTAIVGLATCADVCKHKADRSKDPSGNPLRQPALDTQVPRGDQYDIKWDPTTTGTVSIALLRGPSTNAEEFVCLANSIPNSGSFEWKPSTSLEIDKTHYGLKIIDDATGNYQFSAQFGIKKGDHEEAAPSSSKKASPSSSAHESTGYTYHNATSSAYHTGGTTSKTKSTSSKLSPTKTPSTSVAFMTDTASNPGGPGVSTAVVGVEGGEGGAGAATATATEPASTTPSALPSNSASGLKVTSALLGGVAAIMFFLL